MGPTSSLTMTKVQGANDFDTEGTFLYPRFFLLKSSLFRICLFFSVNFDEKRVFLSLTVFRKTSQKTFMLSLMISKNNCPKTYWKLWRVKNQSKKLTHFFCEGVIINTQHV